MNYDKIVVFPHSIPKRWKDETLEIDFDGRIVKVFHDGCQILIHTDLLSPWSSTQLVSGRQGDFVLYNFRELLMIYGLKPQEFLRAFHLRGFVQIDKTRRGIFMKVFCLEDQDNPKSNETDWSEYYHAGFDELHKLDRKYSWSFDPGKVSLQQGKLNVQGSLTLSDLLDEIPVDAARFFFNARAAETQMEFDLDLAVKQDSENPLYYVQYAHARICSVLRTASEAGIALPRASEADLTCLTLPEERALIKQIALLPSEIVEAAAKRDPSQMNKYGVTLAAQFHKFYNACRIKDAEQPERDARLALCAAARQTIANVLGIIGVDAPEHM